MDQLIYRTAIKSDLKQLQQLGLIAYGQFKQEITHENWVKWEQGFKTDSNFLNLLDISTCFVCELNHEIVGMAFFIPNGNPFLFFPATWSYIRYVGVNPAYGGKGIGKKLTQQCLEAAKERGERVIALHTAEFQNAARNIYEGLGFIKIKDLDLIYGKQYYLYTFEIKQL